MSNPHDQQGTGDKNTSDKNTNDLSSVKDVQKEGMQEKGQQIDQTPESVKNTDQGQHPQQQKR